MRRLLILLLCLLPLVSSAQSFSGSSQVRLNQLAPSGATEDQIIKFDGTKWVPATPSSTGLSLTGGTLTGALSFSGTNHSGLRFNNLTTAQRDALSGNAAGMAVWNTTTSRLSIHDGSAWTSGFVRLNGDTMTGALTNATNGAVSAPVVSLTGSTFAGGTATTTKPTLLIEPTGTTSTGWSTSGTLIGANAATGFVGRLIDLQLAGVSRFSVTSAGVLSLGGNFNLNAFSAANDLSFGTSTNTILTMYAATSSEQLRLKVGTLFGWSPSSTDGLLDMILTRASAANLQLGINAATGTPVAQTLKAPNGTAGQTNQPGGNLTISSGLSTGNGAASVILASSANSAGSTTLNTAVTRLIANASGIAIGANGTPTPTIKHGTATLTAGTVTVSDADVVAGSRIFVNRQTDGGTCGDSYSITRSAGVSFTITSKTASATVTGDTSTVSYLLINP